jgi:hypothetical protein
MAQYQGMATVLAFDAFFDPPYSEPSLSNFFLGDTRYPKAYCHHLWESITWHLLSRINESNLGRFGSSAFAQLADECMTEADRSLIQTVRQRQLDNFGPDHSV